MSRQQTCPTCNADTQRVTRGGQTFDRCPWTLPASLPPADGALWACTSPYTLYEEEPAQHVDVSLYSEGVRVSDGMNL